MSGTPNLSVEGTLVGFDWTAKIPNLPGAKFSQEMQHFSFEHTGNKIV